MEPVDRARKPAEGVTDEIVSPDVCELVKKDCMTPILGPVVAIGWKNNCRVKNAARERHLRVFAPQETRCFVDLEAVCHFI
jgi:hypothetical protein